MQNLKETTALKTYFPALDGFRFIAVSLVLFSHWIYYWQLESLNNFLGFTGVNMFFTLSGFLISRILLVQKTAYRQNGLSVFKSFYLRRALRIFPLYYAVLLAGFLFTIPGAYENGTRLATFTLNIPYSGLLFKPAEYYSHFWSLSAEEQFYIFFPLLIILTPLKYLRHLFWAMVVIGLLSRVVIYFYFTDSSLYHRKWAAYEITLCCLDSFGLGALLGWYFLYAPDLLKKILSNKLVFFVISISFFALSFLVIRKPYSPVPNLFLRLSSSVFFFWFIGAILFKKLPGIICCFLTNALVVYLGKISYGIYIFHLFAPWIVKKFGRINDDLHFAIPLYAVLYTVITLVLASVSWKYFESPLNKLKSKIPYNS